MATSYEKTWAFDLNNDYTPASALDLTRYFMWWWAAALTGNLGVSSGAWTLYASSDSSTAGTDSTDRWVLAGPYDGTKIVRGSGASAHSWIVLKSPSINGSNWYLIISFNTAGDDKIRFHYTKTAPTGGSTTATPTATDKWGPCWTSGVAAVDCPVNAAAADASRFHLGLASDGCWYFITNVQGATKPTFVTMFFGLDDYVSGDLFPVYTFVEYNTGGVIRSSANSYGFTTGVGSGAGNRVRDPSGAAVTSAGCMTPVTNFGGSLTNTSNHPVDGSYSDFPLLIGLGTATSDAQYRGRVPDLAVCLTPATTLVDGTDSPSPGSADSCKVGAWWFPANAAMNFS